MSNDDGQAASAQPAQQLPPVSFEEYRMYFESSEKVVDRRMAFNQSTASLATLVLGGIGILCAWAFDNGAALPLAMIFVALISYLGRLYTLYWTAFIKSQKDLNSAKFKVLAEMAARTVIPAPNDQMLRSCKPFDREWHYLTNEKDTVAKVKGRDVLKSSVNEYLVPQCFRILFSIIAVASIAVAISTLAFPTVFTALTAN